MSAEEIMTLVSLIGIGTAAFLAVWAEWRGDDDRGW